jgi:hypothetical protein
MLFGIKEGLHTEGIIFYDTCESDIINFDYVNNDYVVLI